MHQKNSETNHVWQPASASIYMRERQTFNKLSRLRNQNSQLTKWEFVLGKIKICTLQSETLAQSFYKKTFGKKLLWTFYSPTIMTVTHVFHLCRSTEWQVLGVLKTQTSKPGTTDKKKTILHSLFAMNCFGKIGTEHCAFSTAAFGSWWTSFALFC